ncbi:MAG: inorganic diphosphatase [Patescibacteria group bacterium]
MKVFIENEAGSDQKNLYNEKTLEYKKTVTVSRKYPYSYGFILDTTSGDDDNVDAFIITDKELKAGQIVECEPVGLMEQMEKSWDKSKGDVEEVDHNVLMILEDSGQNIVSDKVKDSLTDFVLHVFDHIRPNKNRVGNFLDKEQALKYIESCKDV